MKCNKCKKEIEGGFFNYLAITRLPINDKINSRQSGICSDLCDDCVELLKEFLGHIGGYYD